MVQVNVFYGEPEKNFLHILDKIQEIDIHIKETLIMLPELFTTGYDLHAIRKHAKVLENNDSVTFLKKIAFEKKVFIYGSVPELFENKIYNTALLINPLGKIIEFYRKIHLFRPLQEHEVFEPGDKITVVSTKFGTVGFSICYDLRFAELFVKQRNENCKIFLLCAEWPIPRITHWITLIKARAIEHQALIIAINRVGEDKTGIYGGNSLIVTPDGTELFHADEKESISSITLDLDGILNTKFLFDIKNEKRLL
jgi:predicted amidohydrolase